MPIPVTETDSRAVAKASGERLLAGMREAARLVGELGVQASPTIYDAGFAHGALMTIKSPIVRACFRTGLGK